MTDDQNSQTQAQNDDPLAASLAGLSAVNDEIEALKIELEKARSETEELRDTAARALAELQNFKRRSEIERADFAKFAAAKTVEAILPAIDNLKRAFAALPEDLAKNGWVQGVATIEKALLDALSKEGLVSIATIGEKCDPMLHEALLLVPDAPDGVIVAELESGYTLGGRVLRVAKVSVGAKKSL